MDGAECRGWDTATTFCHIEKYPCASPCFVCGIIEELQHINVCLLTLIWLLMFNTHLI